MDRDGGPGALLNPPQSTEAAWHAFWALGVAASAGVLLLVAGDVPARALAALVLGVAPGVAGWFWGAGPRIHRPLLLVWCVAAAVAVSLVGGLSGGLAIWCLAPLMAGLILDAPLTDFVAASIASLLIVILAQAVGLASPPFSGGVGLGLSLIGLVSVVAGGAAALAMVGRRTREGTAHLSTEAEQLGDILVHAPFLTLVLDPEGGLERSFGPSEPINPEGLARGLVEAAHVEDRAAVWTALRQASLDGHSHAEFRLLHAPEHRVAAAFRRTPRGQLVAVLRDVRLVEAAASALPSDRPGDLLLLETPGSAEQVLDLERRLAESEDARIQAEDARARAEANALAKSRFLANMSHELRTPLNAIMGFSDIMRQRMFGSLADKYGEYADLIHESGRHLLDLINDVLDMSKIESANYQLARETFDARDAVNAALRLTRLQADDAGVILRGMLPPEPLMVDADRRALKQIVLNLVSNALKFTPAEGAVTVTLSPDGNVMELVVSDTGLGIAEEDLVRLGQPFEQAGSEADRARGTGLGLSLVKALASLHGGEMTIKSRLGEGSIVTVRLPVLA
jgi:two-component system, cell cycle sensor histidine kinase DivJ